jgi:hypothetical protein
VHCGMVKLGVPWASAWSMDREKFKSCCTLYCIVTKKSYVTVAKLRVYASASTPTPVYVLVYVYKCMYISVCV